MRARCFRSELVEDDRLVDAVQELGLEVRAQRRRHGLLHLGLVAAADLDDVLAADVRGHDQDGVAEVDRAALAVGQPPVVEDLEQHVEHVGVRLLDLVEEHHAVGAPAHGFGELAALLVADVARRRADQARDRVLLHVLAHVDAHHRVLVVEQELGERARGLGLADAGRAQEDERADRAVRVLEAGARAAHRRRHRRAARRPGRPRAGAACPPSRAASPARPRASWRPGCRSTSRRSRRSPPR